MPGGRPEFEITEEVIANAYKWAAQGMTKEQIAHNLGLGCSTLFDKQAKYKEFSDALKQGAASGIQQVTNTLFKKATQDEDTTSIIFYLKNRDSKRWNADSKPQEPKETTPEVSITEFMTKLMNGFAAAEKKEKENKEEDS